MPTDSDVHVKSDNMNLTMHSYIYSSVRSINLFVFPQPNKLRPAIAHCDVRWSSMPTAHFHGISRVFGIGEKQTRNKKFTSFVLLRNNIYSQFAASRSHVPWNKKSRPLAFVWKKWVFCLGLSCNHTELHPKQTLFTFEPTGNDLLRRNRCFFCI